MSGYLFLVLLFFIGVFGVLLILFVLRLCLMWLFGVNQLLSVLRDIRDRLPEQPNVVPAAGSPTFDFSRLRAARSHTAGQSNLPTLPTE